VNAKKKDVSHRPLETTRRDLDSNMMAHFQSTGATRGTDILRVLGNPLETVEMPAPQHGVLSRKVEKR
jgi:hypothetical protein